MVMANWQRCQHNSAENDIQQQAAAAAATAFELTIGNQSVSYTVASYRTNLSASPLVVGRRTTSLLSHTNFS